MRNSLERMMVTDLSSSANAHQKKQQIASVNFSSAHSLTAFLLQSMTSKPLVTFHNGPVLALSLDNYITRFFQYMNCSESCFYLAGIYLKRFLQARPDIYVNAMNAHRLALTALVLSAKYLDDIYHTNSYYAFVGGISLSCLNSMEEEFVVSVGYHLFVTNSELNEQKAEQYRNLSSIDTKLVAENCYKDITSLSVIPIKMNQQPITRSPPAETAPTTVFTIFPKRVVPTTKIASKIQRSTAPVNCRNVLATISEVNSKQDDYFQQLKYPKQYRPAVKLE